MFVHRLKQDQCQSVYGDGECGSFPPLDIGAFVFRFSLFDRRLPHLSPRHIEISSRYDFFYAINDLLAGVLFIVGSVLFFKAETEYAATWFFLVGSVLFTVRPAIRVVRNLHLQRVNGGTASVSEGP